MARVQLPTGLPEIDIPYTVAAARYGAAIAAMCRRKALSSAAEAREKPADKFRWSLVYDMAADPDTTDEADFLVALQGASKVYLVGRGFKWRDWEELPTIPPQIMARLEERARLICGQRGQPPELSLVGAEPDPKDLGLQLCIWLNDHPGHNRRLGMAAQHIIRQLEESLKD